MYQLKTLVDADLKHAFGETAARERLSEVALLRKLVIASIKCETQHPSVVPTAELATKSITVYLPEFLKKAVARRARAKHMTTSRWVSALVQSNLMADPVMTHNQLAALNASVRELVALGRNLNQIAKAANTHPEKSISLDINLINSVRTQII